VRISLQSSSGVSKDSFAGSRTGSIPSDISTRSFFNPKALMLFIAKAFQAFEQALGQAGALLRRQLQSLGFKFFRTHLT